MPAPLLEVITDSSEVLSVTTPAKVNLWLEVYGKRDDGFHEIVSLMVPIGLRDQIDLDFATSVDRLEVPDGGAPADSSNLMMAALQRARRSRDIPPIAMRLMKQIPAQAGLGGGSSNAAALLACLHHRFADPRGWSGVISDAAELGSDVPFFLGSGPCLVKGRGEVMEPLEGPIFDNESMFASIWYPGFGLSTADVYQQLSGPLTSGHSCRNFSIEDFRNRRGKFQYLYNRLFDGAQKLDARISSISLLLEDLFPGRWIMTGSGSGFVIVADSQDASSEDACQLRKAIPRALTLEDGFSERIFAESGIHVVPLLTQP
ncbi:MAG: hypothetical protein CBC13_03520 [Planctomycetia bacterium TMED53]|nr:MAG: hypothetical protein CBC13_03520 [Planctomycetia bacterium TMED53]